MSDDLNLIDANVNPIFKEIKVLITSSKNKIYTVKLYLKNYLRNSQMSLVEDLCLLVVK